MDCNIYLKSNLFFKQELESTAINTKHICNFVYFFVFLLQFTLSLRTLNMHNLDRLSFDIFDASHVLQKFTRRNVLNNRSTVHVVAGNANKTSKAHVT